MATKTKVTAPKPVKKTASKAAPAKRAGKAGARRARVRMYRVGLGDCFLLTSYEGEKPRHMLIDCGMFAGSRLDPSAAEKTIQSQVVEEIAAATGGHLDRSEEHTSELQSRPY